MSSSSTRSFAAALLLVPLLFACSSGKPAADTTAAPAESTPAPAHDMAGMTGMSGMDASVTIPRGAIYTAADVHFMQGMIAHHAQAIFMSRLAASHGANPRLLKFANTIEQSQMSEIRLMQDWLRANGQTAPENCVSHNGGLIPVPGRDLMVQGWYQGGVDIINFTDPDKPFEIGFFDRGPVDAPPLVDAGPGGARQAPARGTIGGSWGANCESFGERDRGREVGEAGRVQSAEAAEDHVAGCVSCGAVVSRSVGAWQRSRGRANDAKDAARVRAMSDAMKALSAVSK